MNDKEINRLIQEALRKERELPEGLSDRLEQHIDQLAADEKRISVSPARRSSVYYWLGGIAASFILGIAIFLQVESQPLTPTMADTFTDPTEAAIAAQDALAFLSTQLNKGLDQVNEAGKEVNRINTIVNKQMDALNIQQ